MVPGLAVDRRKRASPVKWSEFAATNASRHPPTAPAACLVGQQDELTVAVASALPLALTVLEVDAREDASVETERWPLHDKIIELTASARLMSSVLRPSAGSRRIARRRTPIPPAMDRADQDVAVCCQSRLQIAPPSHECSHSSAPSAGATLTAPGRLRSRICATPRS